MNTKPFAMRALAALAMCLPLLASVSLEALAVQGELDQDLDDAIVGTLNHVLHSQMDCSSELPAGGYICNRDRPGELRLQGGWDSVIEPAFKLMGISVKSPVYFVDSNMFTTAAVLYPLWMIDARDTVLDVDRATRLAIGNIDVHRRGEGYSFWPVLGPASGEVDRIGPLNLYSILLGAQVDLARRIQQTTGLSFMPRDVKWIGSAFSDTNSKLKKDVLFSVPSDADDTALAIASRYLHSQDRLLEGAPDTPKALSDLRETLGLVSSLNRYTDTAAARVNRAFDRETPGCRAMFERDPSKAFSDIEFLEKCSLDDPRERWRHDAFREKGSYSGAYMTWLYDERRDLFADPELGVILTGQNSVDCVVVANSLLAVSLSGMKGHPDYKQAYEDSCNTLTNVILDSNDRLRTGISGRNNAKIEPAWRYCGLFYPAHLTFPYKLSRAVRDGGACKDLSRAEDQRRFNLALSTLLRDVADERSGDHWRETIDNTTHLPTALALLTMLNLGEEVAADAGLDPGKLDSMITGGLGYLVRAKKAQSPVNGLPNYEMEAGTFFGGGTLNEIALWKSSAFATSAFLEAALKYRMGAHHQKHLATAVPDRRKLRLRDVSLNGPGELATFNGSELPIDDSAFKRDYLRDALAAPDSLGRPAPHTPDRLPKPEISKYVGALQLGTATDMGGDVLGIVGIELDYGSILRDGNTQIAYYLVRTKTTLGFRDTSAPEVELAAQFMGIATDAPEVRDNVGFIPVTVVREKDLLKLETHGIQADAQLPLVNLGKGVRLDLDIGGRLLGYAYRRAKNEQGTTVESHSVVPLTLSIGVVLQKEGLGSLNISAATELEYMKREQAKQEQRKFYAPTTAKVTATHQLTERLEAYVEYSYTRDEILYPDGDHRVTGGIKGLLEKPKKKRAAKK